MASHGPGPLERDTCRDAVMPMLRTSGWDPDQVIEQYPVRAQRILTLGAVARELGSGAVDYVLEATPGTPVAVVEAKRSYRSATDGMQQALRYAQQLDVPLAYATNGRETIEHNLRLGTERRVQAFAPPATAWSEYQAMHGLDDDGAHLLAEPFNRRRTTVAGDVLTPRHYQVVAVNRVLAAIARGRRRVLLLMATGTGKTFTAMQVVAKLRAHETALHPDRNHRILYLADRDQLLRQPMLKDFTPAFGGDVLNRVRGGVDTSREIYFASYQALSGTSPDTALFSLFRPDFFDLVIVDECHRGSAEENSAWRAVLDHFTSAVHLGLTATPRHDRVNSYDYFGNPVFEYTLRQGIEDGYLAPYRVRRVALSPDAEGWEPEPGQLDRFGREIPEGIYGTRDFERVVSLLGRTRLAARHLSAILRADPGARCIVFCVDTDHADEMRHALIAENPDLVRADPEWVVRIVGIEGEKERLLEDFCDPERSSPVVATTSRLLSTGVDVEDLKYVVLFRPVGSMVEFKQIVGRGTRLYPDKNKTSFEIVDYVGASALFEDPDFDGYPSHVIAEVVDDAGTVVAQEEAPTHATQSDDGAEDGPPVLREPEPEFTVANPPNDPAPPARRKYVVDEGDFSVRAEGRLVPDTSSGQLRLTEYGTWVRGRITALGAPERVSADWAHAETRHGLVRALEEQGIELDELMRAFGLEDSDPLDALLHLAWNAPTRTRAERVRSVRQTRAAELEAASQRAREVLDGLLERYAAHGIEDLESRQVYRMPPLRDLGSPMELARALGGRDALQEHLDLVQGWLYSA